MNENPGTYFIVNAILKIFNNKVIVRSPLNSVHSSDRDVVAFPRMYVLLLKNVFQMFGTNSSVSCLNSYKKKLVPGTKQERYTKLLKTASKK